MAIATRLTQRFGLSAPIILAPMAYSGGGLLAAACARAGILGLVGGGYGDREWTQREYTLALQARETRRVGCGFITWKLQDTSRALDWMLDQNAEDRPRALMLSFGELKNIAARIKAKGIDLLCQITRMEELQPALDAGADVVIAQGAEGGGHGRKALESRSTFTFVPEVADALAKKSPETLLLAAGGIADGRGLVAALALGADGVLMGSRFYVSKESLAPPEAKAHAVLCDGDQTARSGIFDILRKKDWPSLYDFRAVRNDLHRQWEGREDELSAQAENVRRDYEEGVKKGDYARAHVTVGQAVGLMHDIPSAGDLVTRICEEASAIARATAQHFTDQPQSNHQDIVNSNSRPIHAQTH